MDPQNDLPPSAASQATEADQGANGSKPDTPATASDKARKDATSSMLQVWSCIFWIAIFGVGLLGIGAWEIAHTVNAIAAQAASDHLRPEEKEKLKEALREFELDIGKAVLVAIVVLILGFGFLWASGLCGDGRWLCIAWKKVFHEFGMALLVAALILLAVEVTIRISEANSTRKTFADYGQELKRTADDLKNEYKGLTEKYEKLNNDVTAQLRNLEAQQEVKAHLSDLLQFQGKREEKNGVDYLDAIKSVDSLLATGLKNNTRLWDIKSSVLDDYGQHLWKNRQLLEAEQKFRAAHVLDEKRAKHEWDAKAPTPLNQRFYHISIARLVDVLTEQERRAEAKREAEKLINEHKRFVRDTKGIFAAGTDPEDVFLNGIGFLRPDLNELVKIAISGSRESKKRHPPSKVFLAWLALPETLKKAPTTKLAFEEVTDKEGRTKITTGKNKSELTKEMTFDIYEVKLAKGATYGVLMLPEKKETPDCFVVLVNSRWEVVRSVYDLREWSAVGRFECNSDGTHYVIATSLYGSRRMERSWQEGVEKDQNGEFSLELVDLSARK